MFYSLRKVATICALIMVAGSCDAPIDVEIIIDDELVPSVAEVPGLDGGPPRAVGVVVEPSGLRTEFVQDEVILVPESLQSLDDFLEKYEGVVIRRGTPKTRSYIVRVDLSATSWNDLAANLNPVGTKGRFAFSSERAAKLAGLVARERDKNAAGFNFLLSPNAIEEHPDDMGGFINWETSKRMTEDDSPSEPGEQGLSIGVTHAWEYMEYVGVPQFGGRSSIAVIDAGFALHEETGLPLIGNLDFVRNSTDRPVQIDVVDGDNTAGGAYPPGCVAEECDWHGTNVHAIAAAVHSNRYGGAGTSGNFAFATPIKFDGTFGVLLDAIYVAVDDLGVDVVNISWSWECGFWCDLSQFFGLGKSFAGQLAINHADNNGVVVVASAGNDGVDLGQRETLPCELEPVVCVGSINFAGANVYNYGDSVDIWAPTNIYSTVTPATAVVDSDGVGFDELEVFDGTSASAPFVAGIVAMMKALNDTLKTAEIEEILRITANRYTADVAAGARVSKGWVDAYEAVTTVRANEEPRVEIIWPPDDGVVFASNWTVSVLASVVDPENDATGTSFTDDVVFTENGVELCRGNGSLASCTLPPLLPGFHRVTATATDRFGASGSDTVEFEIVDRPPVARIDFPKEPNNSFCADQELCFQGTGYDLDDVSPASVSIEWTLDGGAVLSTEPHFCTTLSEGSHNVSLKVTDVAAQTATDDVDISVLPSCGHPSTRIISPGSFMGFGAGQTITFVGEGTDPEDGAITDNNLVWHSSVDGPIGTGGTITTNLTSPQSLGAFDGLLAHTITLTAIDSDGNAASTDQIVVLVGVIQ